MSSDEVIMSCNEVIMGCDEVIMGCDEVIMGCEEVIMGCDEVIMGCEEAIMSCDEVIMGCDEVIMGCDKVIMGCDEVIMGCDEVIMGCEEVISSDTVSRGLCRSKESVTSAPALPPWPLEGARLPSIVHSCHHHYAHLPSPHHAHQRLLDSPDSITSTILFKQPCFEGGSCQASG
uniref:Uncharacterized protein n=1 Tax=Salmo trutta TaxID=8032 RepID=A0A674BZN1_SALTR